MEVTDEACKICGAFMHIPGSGGSHVWFRPCINPKCDYEEGACRNCGSRDGFEHDGDLSNIPDFSTADPYLMFELTFNCKNCGHEITIDMTKDEVNYQHDEDDDDED